MDILELSNMIIGFALESAYDLILTDIACDFRNDWFS